MVFATSYVNVTILLVCVKAWILVILGSFVTAVRLSPSWNACKMFLVDFCLKVETYKRQIVSLFLWYYLKICLKNFAFANPIRDQGLTCELELSRKCLILISVYLNWRKSWLMWCFWILLNNIWCSESENNLSLQRKKRKKKKRSRDLGLNLKLICWNVLFGFFFYL